MFTQGIRIPNCKKELKIKSKFIRYLQINIEKRKISHTDDGSEKDIQLQKVAENWITWSCVYFLMCLI